MNPDKRDQFWLGMAHYIATEASKDPSTQVAAVIVRPNNTIASFGYNGFPSAMEDRPEWLNDRDEKYPRTIHAELNALHQLWEDATGYTLYVWPFPVCAPCAIHIVQRGIKRIVSPPLEHAERIRWGTSMDRGLEYFADCGVEVTFVNRS